MPRTPGLRHVPYTIICVQCGKQRKAASLGRLYCNNKCKWNAFTRRRRERERTIVQEIKQEVSSDEPGREEVWVGAPAGEMPQTPAIAADGGAGVPERSSSADAVPTEATTERVGRQPDSERPGVPLARSPVSGLLYIAGPEVTSEVECQGCGTLFWGVPEGYVCNQCWEEEG